MDSGGAFKCMKLLVKKHRFDVLPKTGFPRIKPVIGEYEGRFGKIRNWRAAWTRSEANTIYTPNNMTGRPRACPLLNPLLAFFGIRITCYTKASFMSSDQASNDLVFPQIADSFLISFSRPWPRVELWPVDLHIVSIA